MFAIFFIIGEWVIEAFAPHVGSQGSFIATLVTCCLEGWSQLIFLTLLFLWK